MGEVVNEIDSLMLELEPDGEKNGRSKKIVLSPQYIGVGNMV